MVTWIEATGRNEEAAIAAALAQLSLERDDVSVEVLERAKSGFLGIGSCPARVKVSYEVPDEPAPSPKIASSVDKKEAPRSVQPPVKKPEPEAPKRQPEPKKPLREAKVIPPQPTEPPSPAPKIAPPVSAELPSDPQTEEGANLELEPKIVAFLSGLMEQMDVQATPRVSPRENGYLVRLEGENLGALIGHRGETLDAIQQLCNYSVNRDRQKRVRIQIDVEHYRQKREESLKRLATKVAAKVVKYRRNITLEPMNAYERHMIHETLQDYPDVATYSTGTEPYRRTVVAFQKGKHGNER